VGISCSTHGEKINAFRFFVRKPERKRPQGRARRTYEDNINMDSRETKWGDMGWIHLVQGRDHWRALVNTVKNFRVPRNIGKFWSICATRGLSRRIQLHEVILVN
jgi:hypothetical protein